MVLEMVMESVFAVCDVFFVSKLGAAAVATVGLTESWVVLIYALAMGLAIAASATVARRTGERDAEGAAVAAAQAMVLSLSVSLVLGVLGVFLAPTLLARDGRVARRSHHGIDVCARDARWRRRRSSCCILINAIFRGAGDAAIAMRVLWFANAINIVLGPLLIFGVGPFPKLGVTGAAVATNIGRGAGALFAFSRLLKPGSRIDIHVRHLRIDPGIDREDGEHGVVGRGAAVDRHGQLDRARENSLDLRQHGHRGLHHRHSRRLVRAPCRPAGLANAAATMVGQALGAEKPERAEASVKIAGWYNVVVLSVVGLVLGRFRAGDRAVVHERSSRSFAVASSSLRMDRDRASRSTGGGW